MRKLLMAASAAAIAISMPALAKPDKQGGGGKGGGKPEHAQKADNGHGGGGGHKDEFKAAKADRPEKADRGWAKQEMKAEKQFRKAEGKPDKGWAKSEAKAEKQFRKNEQKAQKQFAKQQDRVRNDDMRMRDDDRRLRDEARFADRRYEDGGRRMASLDGCPPGLAKKNNGCLPPGQVGKLGLGQRLPDHYYQSYNIPARYQDWYQDGGDYAYRYGDGNIYRVDSGTNLISGLIPLLGGGFGIGNLLPAGYDVYNLPTQYRDDYVDSEEAYYRYGDNAIYQVDPKTQMIEAVVALLAGNLNVGQVLPAGYDSYNLPMQYRDQYVDSDEAMYRYADGNIYEVDPKTQIIEQIVAMLT
jgi:hypothetical protein